MSNHPNPDWDPLSLEAQRDPQATADGMREHCPVAWSQALHWSLFRQADVLRAVKDHTTFSSVVSRHVAVPNGMDPPQHAAYRRAIEPYFSKERVDAFEPQCRAMARSLIAALPRGPAIEWMGALALPFAVWAQCDFLGWQDEDHAGLAQWMQANHAATLAQDRAAHTELAAHFQAVVTAQLERRRGASTAAAPGDITCALMQEKVNGVLLTDAEIASILGGRHLPAGSRVTLHWPAANRDPRAFDAALEYRPERSQEANLLWGAGIHVCPGAPLAQMELRVLLEEVLASGASMEAVPGQSPEPALYPASGWARVPLRLLALQAG